VLWKFASTPQKHPSANVAFSMVLFYSGLQIDSTAARAVEVHQML
jgi:hypothetical protein